MNTVEPLESDHGRFNTGTFTNINLTDGGTNREVPLYSNK